MLEKFGCSTQPHKTERVDDTGVSLTSLSDRLTLDVSRITFSSTCNKSNLWLATRISLAILDEMFSSERLWLKALFTARCGGVSWH